MARENAKVGVTPGRRSTAKDDVRPGNGRSTPALRYSLKIHRDNLNVHVIFTAESEYSSIELYDRLVKSANAGSLNFSAVTGVGGLKPE